MALAPGTCLGPYEIVAALGAGGMGEVYRARDTRLKRDVAIKVLPDGFSQDSDRLARFQREAELLATLNHPNIAAVYGLEKTNDLTGIVLELVEGETLADLIARGPLGEALPIARQICDALEAAHEKGVIHRDLKPANIKVTPTGQVKVLDFGLAKMLEPDASPTSLTMSPTLSVRATYAGVILGTAAYMSPEQARGKPVDRRTDVWAFGCVLFEMLTGRQAFDPGETVSDAVAAVLTREPGWNTLPARTPPAIRRLLRRCLQKDPQQRIPHIGVARIEIEEARAESATSSDVPVRQARPRLGERVLWAVGALLLLAIGLVANIAGRKDVIPTVVRFEIQPPSGEVFPGAQGVPRFAVSPDGQHIAFVSDLPAKRDALWIRSLNALDAKLIRGTELLPDVGRAGGLQQPFWSPDSRNIAFFDERGGKLRKVDIHGGAVETVWELPGNQYGGSWNASGIMLVATLATRGIQRISDKGGAPEQVTTVDTPHREISHLWPQFLPDGRHFLYHVQTAGPAPSAIYVGSLDAPDRKRLIDSDYMGQFAPPNQLLYMRGTSLVAQTVDLSTFELTGEPSLLAESIMGTRNGRAGISASDTGVLVYVPGPGDTQSYQIAWRDRSNTPPELFGPAVGALGLRLSPDGKKVAFTDVVADGRAAIWVYDVDRKVRSALTTDHPSRDSSPIWSPDGAQLVFRSRGENGTDGLYQKPATGAIAEKLLIQFEPGAQVMPLDWSSDSESIVFRKTVGGRSALWVLSHPADPKPVTYLSNPSFSYIDAALSPNGRWAAYASNESGTYQVHVQPFPDPSGDKRQISSTGGTNPRWRRDGRELYYVDLDGRIIAVSVTTAGDFNVGKSTPLFATPLGLSSFDVTADGEHFVLLGPPSATSTPLTVTLNWTAGLKK
jgi:Tol biopolymer transport system component